MNKKAEISLPIRIFIGMLMIGFFIFFFWALGVGYNKTLELDGACENIGSIRITDLNDDYLTCLNKETGTTREFYYECDWGFYNVDCEYIEINQEKTK